jgi:type IV pilus assembly protein PilQ
MKNKTTGLLFFTLLSFVITLAGCAGDQVVIGRTDQLPQNITFEQSTEQKTEDLSKIEYFRSRTHNTDRFKSSETNTLNKDRPDNHGASEKQKYTGKKITLDFFDIDIRNVFHLMSRVSGKNFAIDNDVKGKVTLTLDKSVPWDQVLDLILRMNQLGMTLENDIIRIATLKTLKQEEEIKLEEEQTAPLITEYISVNYANAKTDVMPHISLTPKRGSISVDDRNNQIIIKDTAEVVRQARETVRKIDKVTPQVMIEARIIEASDLFSREIGSTFSSSGTLIDTDNILGSTGTSYTISATNPPVSNLGNIGLVFTRASGIPFSTISAQIDASESKGLLSIISAPKILTMSNKTAIIKQGVRYPFTSTDTDGNISTTLEDIVLELQVTPHVTSDKRISMTIKISNNEIGNIINNQTSFTTKETSTELLINDRDTVIIGGIKKTLNDFSDSGIPVLKDIPVLGWFFGKKSRAQTKTELIIFIKPEIVQLEPKIIKKQDIREVGSEQMGQ